MADPSAVIKNAQTAADARQAMMYALVRPQTDMKEEMRMEATDTVVSAIEKFGNMKPPKYDVAPPPCGPRLRLPRRAAVLRRRVLVGLGRRGHHGGAR